MPAAAEAAAEAPLPVDAKRLYFINAPVDYLLIGALSIATFLLLRAFYNGDRTNAVITLGLLGTFKLMSGFESAA